MVTGRISQITDTLFTQGNLIIEPHYGILYNFEIYDNYIELRYFLTKFVVKVVDFKDRFYMWDELSKTLEEICHMLKN
jgi:hypothetical protein